MPSRIGTQKVSTFHQIRGIKPLQETEKMKDKDLQIARRVARMQVIKAKHSKGWISGEKAAQIYQAIKNSNKG